MRRGRRKLWGSVLVTLGLLGGAMWGGGLVYGAPEPAAAAPGAPGAPEPGAAEPVSPEPAAQRAAGLQDFTFDTLHVDYELGRAEDGTSILRVTEAFTARFPDVDQNQGMRRTIPASYLGVPTHPSFVSVTDGAGAPRPAEVESVDDVLVITSRGAGFVHGVQHYPRFFIGCLIVVVRRRCRGRGVDSGMRVRQWPRRAAVAGLRSSGL